MSQKSELDALRDDYTRQLADVRGQLGVMSRTLARRLLRERQDEQKALVARLNAGDLRGQQWHTRKGESDKGPLAMPLNDRLRQDYSMPAGTLDRLALATVGQFDSSNSLELFFSLPGTDYDVYECRIGVAFRQFYATATAAASAGSSSPTSGASSTSSSGASSATTTGASNTASSGSSSSASSGASSATTTGASDTTSSSSNATASSTSTSGSSAAASSATTTGADAINHTHDVLDFVSTSPGALTLRRFSDSHAAGQLLNFESNFVGTLKSASGGVNHDHGMSHTHSHSHGMSHTHPHSHDIDHHHNMPHTHGIGHTHDIPHTHNLPHTHDISHTHSVTISGHTHDLVFGIYKEAMPASWSVTLRLYEYVASVWTLRATSAAITSLVGEADFTADVTGSGYWLVTVQSDAAQPNGGRLSAQVFGTVVGAIRTA